MPHTNRPPPPPPQPIPNWNRPGAGKPPVPAPVYQVPDPARQLCPIQTAPPPSRYRTGTDLGQGNPQYRHQSTRYLIRQGNYAPYKPPPPQPIPNWNRPGAGKPPVPAPVYQAPDPARYVVL